MGNERKLRLIQVAKEFNVGINTITDFLHKKGIKNDGSPNALVDADTYAVLEKEFGSNRSAAGARNVDPRAHLPETGDHHPRADPQAGARGGERGGHQEQRHQREGRDPAAEVPR